MPLVYLIFSSGLVAFGLLVLSTLKRREYAVLGLSVAVISAVVFLTVAAYRLQIGYDHVHMTKILQLTADTIHAGRAEEVMSAYDSFKARMASNGLSFWENRNQLYADLVKLGTKTNSVQLRPAQQ